MGSKQIRLDEMVHSLKEAGCRLTPQRMAVLRVLVESEDHPSAEQIHEHVRADFPMTSLATIYKTLTLLKEMGEVQELSIGEGGSRYDGHSPDPHPHLVCTACGRIDDVQVRALGDLPEEVARKTGYRITGHRFDFFGICPRCQRRAAWEQGKKEEDRV